MMKWTKTQIERIGKDLKTYGDRKELHILAEEIGVSEAVLRNIYHKNFGAKTE